MDKDQLILAVRTVVHDRNIRLNAIEKQLGIPENALSGMLNGKRRFPKKWQMKLTVWLGTQDTMAAAAAPMAI